MKERDMGVSLALLYFFIVYVSGFVVKLAPISLKKSTFLKNQDNVIYDSETMQKLTTQLLLEQEKATKSSRNDNDDEHDEDDVTVKTFSFSFKAKHTHKIQLPGIELADMYLSLPASEYSILSSSLISRSPTSEKNNTFILSIPLGDYRVIDATLQAEVIVDPQPSSCRVLMESSNIVFLPTNVMKKRASGDVMGSYSSLSDDLRSKVINSNNLSEAVEIILESGEVDDDAPISNYIVAPPIGEWLGVEVNSTGSSSNISGSADSGNSLPNWLIWGGEGPVGKESDGGVLSNATGPVRSSVQVKLQVELKWRRGYSGSASSNPLSWLRGGFQRVFSSQSTQSQFSIMNSSRVLAQMNSTDVSDEIFLPVEASVRVWVDGNIPLKGNTARKIARTPLSRIVPLVGSIATSTAMKALAPTLGDLLVSDYLGRRKSLGQKLEPEPSPNTYNEST